MLVVGASGLLGGEVCRQALAAGCDVVGSFHRAPGQLAGMRWHWLDLRDRVAVDELVTAVRPTVVINAGYARDSWTVTADGAGYVAVASAGVGARLVHLSSDAVHGGRPAPYGDDESPTPIFTYGAAKAAAETAVRLVDPAAVLVRTSLILGDESSPQIRFCLDLLTGRVDGTLFSDEVRCPVAVADLAAAVLELAGSKEAGVLNVAGPQEINRVSLALLVAARYRKDPSRLRVSTVAESGLVRPAEVRLDSTRAAELLRTRVRGVTEVLA